MAQELETMNDEAIPEDLQGLKVGDEVFCLLFGHGVVDEIDPIVTYSIRAVFGDDDHEAYTPDGLWRRDLRRTLYRANSGVIEIDTAKVETFERGQKVWARGGDNSWFPRYYSHFEDGKHCCFVCGGTEWSSSGLVTGWNRVRSTDPNAEAAQ